MRIEVLKIGESVDIHFQLGIVFKDCLNLTIPQAEQILHDALTGKLFTEEEKKLEEEKAKDEEIRKGPEKGVSGDCYIKKGGVPSIEVSREQGSDRLGSVEKTRVKTDTGKKQSGSKQKGK
jgi:hypothetical protein